MIITVLPVCPPQVRPSVSVDATLRSEDDLTSQYNQILKANIQLKKQEDRGAPSHATNDTAVLLQFFVAALMNNEMSKIIFKNRFWKIFTKEW
jgi:DNA-directed RNA polymerase II subunit RPB1